MQLNRLDNITSYVLDEVQRSSSLEGEPRSRSAQSKRKNEPASQATGRQRDTVTISPEAAEKSKEEQEKQRVEELKSTEEKVRAHEAAHQAAGGQYAGSASYQYQTGPDGRSYITGGEVQIDLSPGKTPQETIAKMQTVIRAALAPSDPSPQDLRVAAEAAAIMAEAQQELAKAQSSVSASAGKGAVKSDAANSSQTLSLNRNGDGRPGSGTVASSTFSAFY